MNFFLKVTKLINFKEKILILILTLLILISMLLEVVSIGAVIPVISSLLEHNKFSENFDFLNNFRFFELLKNLNIFYTVCENDDTANHIKGSIAKSIVNHYFLHPFSCFISLNLMETVRKHLRDPHEIVHYFHIWLEEISILLLLFIVNLLY